jgi:peptidoglycan lytic transglycosylase
MTFGACQMDIATGVRRRDDDTGKGRGTSGRILRGFLLAVIGSAGFLGSNAEVSRASPLQLVSYAPTHDFVVLSLKNSSMVPARVRQETLPSRYDAVAKPVATMAPATAIEWTPQVRGWLKAYASQAACTGHLFDACPGFMDLLQTRRQAWPRFADAALPAARASDVIMASADETVSLVTEDVLAPVDWLSMRAGEVIIGAASTYNPYDANDNDAGGAETASGELYNPIAWTAAIQIDLRGRFAGVRYGRLYQPSFALVELNGRRAVVKINDVGPLRPGRVIDLSTQAMHYFDPTLRRGVLDGMLVTPLVGSNWTPGPLGLTPAVAVASSL